MRWVELLLAVNRRYEGGGGVGFGIGAEVTLRGRGANQIVPQALSRSLLSSVFEPATAGALAPPGLR